MGLLDNLLMGQGADYGGQSVGLLDMLRNMTSQQNQYQPSQGFPEMPPPASFADRFNAMPGAPAAYQPAPQSISPANYDPSAFAPNQAQPIGVGNYQMPRIGSAPQFAPDPNAQAAIPQNAQPTQGQLPPQAQVPEAQQPLPPAFGGSGYLDRLNNGGGLIGSMLGDTTQQKNLKAQYDALVPLLGQQKAMLAVMNPEAGKTLISEALTNKEKYQKTGVDGLGRETYGFVNEREQTINGKPLSAGGAQSSEGLGDMNKGGEEYLTTLPKQVQGTVRGMLDGTIQPPSSFAAAKPYWQSMIAAAKNADPSWDENKWASRHKMSTDVAASSNSSMGGILSNGKSAFKHLAEYIESAADQGNASHNFPLGGVIAHGQNYVGNTLGGSDIQGKVKAINDNLGKYGAESTKFYAGTGGGVEERMNALKEMNGTTTSGEEAAAFAQKEKSLMLDRLREKELQIRDTMGEQYLKQHPVFTDDLKNDIARIDANIAKLKGGSPAPTTALPSGWSVKVR